ncbi:S41 family peptidase [Metamycoplasma auris]|nr:S41 family peptidase [Metamycoplasma auris]
MSLLSFFPIFLVSCKTQENNQTNKNPNSNIRPLVPLEPTFPSNHINPKDKNEKNNNEFFLVNYFVDDKLLKTSNIKANTTLKPELIQRENYIFEGYYLDKEFKNKLKKDLIVKQNLNIYLKYFKYSSYPVHSLIDTIALRTKSLKLLNNDEISYVEIKDFFKLVEELTLLNEKNENIKFNEEKYDLTKNLNYETNNKELIVTLSCKYQKKDTNNKDFEIKSWIKFDSAINKISISNYLFFKLINPYEYESYLDFKYQDFKNEIVIDLNKYNLKMLRIDNQIFIPFNLLNQIILAEYENAFYFNEDEIFLLSYLDVHKGREEFKEIKHKILKNQLDKEEIPSKLKEFQYNYLYFLLDNFYGIKFKNNNHFLKLLSNYKNKLLGSNDEHYQALHHLINDLDDIHTKVLMQGLYEKEANYNNYSRAINIKNLKKIAKERTKRFYEIDDKLHNLEIKLGFEGISILDSKDKKTRMINFNIITRETIETYLKKDLKEAKEQGIKNIVLNLALNQGGSVQATWELFGFMTDQYFKYYEYNPLAKEKILTEIKSSIGKYDDFKYYILVSPITYSASNMLAAVAKENKLAKIIGYQSAGGASIVRFSILPTGNIIRLSSNNVLTNQNFESYELGVIPDIDFTKEENGVFEKLFDIEYISTLINKNN